MFEIKLYEIQKELDTLKEALMLERTSRQLIEQSNARLQREVDSFAFKENDFRDKENSYIEKIVTLEKRISEYTKQLEEASKFTKLSNASGDAVQSLKDQIAAMQKSIDLKSKEALDAIFAKRDLERSVQDFKMESDTLRQQVELLELSLRQFSSFGNDVDYEETYEAVLRSEFELMRHKFEKQVSSLKEELKDVQIKCQAQVRNLQKEVDDLKVQKDSFALRLGAMRLQVGK